MSGKITAKVFNENHELLGELHIQGTGHLSMATLYSDSQEWLQEVQDFTQSPFGTVKSQMQEGFYTTLGPKSLKRFYNEYPVR